MDARELLNLREAARFLGCSERHVWHLARKEKVLPCVEAGRRVMFSVRHLREWIDKQAGVKRSAEGNRDDQ